jgi:hypothetical protein
MGIAAFGLFVVFASMLAPVAGATDPRAWTDKDHEEVVLINGTGVLSDHVARMAFTIRGGNA